MADSAAGEVAYLGGVEVVNSARTIAYIQNGYGPPGLTVHGGGCWCPNSREIAGCDPSPYTIPSDDPAPWFNTNIPESADFAGFLPTSFEGMGSTFTRPLFPKITGGAVIGRKRPQERVMTWRGFLFGRSTCAVQYGLRWLMTQLSGIECGCDTEDLDILVCCPESADQITECKGLPSIQFTDPCTDIDTIGKFEAFRLLKEVSLFEGPTIISERKTGCRSGDCSSDMEGVTNCTAESIITEIEFSLVAGNPFFHGCPVMVCQNMQFEPSIECGIVWIKDSTGTLCVGCPDPINCLHDSENPCPQDELPKAPPFEDQCFCDPIEPVTACCQVPASSFGDVFEGVPIVQIRTGSVPLRGTSIRFYQNPIELGCDAVDDPCNICDELKIRFIPANSIFTLDGTTRQVSIICPGENIENAGSVVAAPFTWPSLKCISYCVCFTTEGAFQHPDAEIDVIIVPRQM